MLVLAAVLMFGTNAQAAPTAQEIMKTAADRLLKAKGISAGYIVTVKGHGSVNGSIKVQGKSFVISHAQVSTWFDGKTQWNYSHSSNEVTISTPTPEEIQAVNPYALLSSYKSLYTATLEKSKIPGTYAILLTAKSKSSAVKKATLYLRHKDYQPARVDVTADDGSVSTIIITGIQTGQSYGPSTFRFNAKAYPGVTVVDLR